jgi:hypothetical protein
LMLKLFGDWWNNVAYQTTRKGKKPNLTWLIFTIICSILPNWDFALEAVLRVGRRSLSKLCVK